MLKVKVKLLGGFREIFLSTTLFIDIKDGSTLQDVIQWLVQDKKHEFTRLDVLLRNTIFLINDVDANLLNGLDTKLSNEDNITLLPAIHGG